MKRFIQLSAILLVLSGAVQTLSAAVVFYTDEAAFDAAAGDPATFGFDGLISGGSAMGFGATAGLTLNGFNFVGTTGSPNNPYYLGSEGPDFYGSDYDHIPGASSIQGPALSSSFYSIVNGVLTITAPQGGVTAFGLNVFDVLTGSFDGSGTDTVKLTAAGSTGSVVTPAFTGAAFLGFISDSPVTTVTLQGSSPEEFPTITQIDYLGSSVPEPATAGTMALAGLALCALAFWRREKGRLSRRGF